MKIFKIISIIFTVISTFLLVFVPWVSSEMQSFYKNQMPTSAEYTKEILDKKQFWVTVGESNVFGIAFILCVCILLIVFLIDFIIKKKKK